MNFLRVCLNSSRSSEDTESAVPLWGGDVCVEMISEVNIAFGIDLSLAKAFEVASNSN